MKTLIIGAIGIRPFLVAELIERYNDAKIITGMNIDNTREPIESHFCDKLCNDTYVAIKYKFPNIENLEVGMDDEGSVNVIFDETEYTSQQVQDFLDEFKIKKPCGVKGEPHNIT